MKGTAISFLDQRKDQHLINGLKALMSETKQVRGLETKQVRALESLVQFKLQDLLGTRSMSYIYCYLLLWR